MPTNQADAWNRLGQLLVERRIDLDPRYKNRRTFCEERGVDYKVVSDIETAKRTNFGRDTIAHLEIAYEAKAGGIQAVLDGAKSLPPREKRNPFEDADDLEVAIIRHADLSEEAKRTLLNVYRAYRDKPLDARFGQLVRNQFDAIPVSTFAGQEAQFALTSKPWDLGWARWQGRKCVTTSMSARDFLPCCS